MVCAVGTECEVKGVWRAALSKLLRGRANGTCAASQSSQDGVTVYVHCPVLSWTIHLTECMDDVDAGSNGRSYYLSFTREKKLI